MGVVGKMVGVVDVTAVEDEGVEDSVVNSVG